MNSDPSRDPPSKGGGDPAPPRILIVDDDVEILDFYQAALRKNDYRIETAQDGKEAAELLRKRQFDLIVSDVSMPGMDGIQLLRAIREIDLDIPVVLATGGPTLDTAMKAIEYGALRYLTKPVEPAALRKVVEYGVNLHKMTRAKREALKLISGGPGLAGDRAGLEASFEKALAALVLNFQPIISWTTKKVYAYEILIRTTEPSLPRPLELFEAAEKLDRAQELGRGIRLAVSKAMDLLAPDQKLFVNLHPRDLDDRSLYSSEDPLAKHAHRVVLEVSERASLDLVKDARTRIAQLRSLGYKIAMDDLGAGHAGLATFAHLEPDVVKLDMALVRGADKEPLRRKLIRSISELCRDLQMQVITEGIETAAERDAIVSAGCDLLQGYLFGRPEKVMAPALWV